MLRSLVRNSYAVDAASGQEWWHFPTRGEVSSYRAVADGVVYIGSNDFYRNAVASDRGP